MAHYLSDLEYYINEHGLFQEFRTSCPSRNRLVRNLYDVKKDICYMFNPSTALIYVTRSTTFIDRRLSRNYQVYKTSIPVKGTVTRVRVNDDNTQLAVFSDYGLYIVEIPYAVYDLMQQDHPYEVNSKTWMILPVDHKMHTTYSYELMQARWHPTIHSLILVVYNDNYLRIVNTQTRTLVKSISLGSHPYHPVSTVVALGEHVIDFDFLPPSEKMNRYYNNNEIMSYNIVLLRGNGDVFLSGTDNETPAMSEMLKIRVSTDSSPPMYENNACAVLVMPCTPAIINIAFKNGHVFHCVLLEDCLEPFLQLFEDIRMPLDLSPRSPCEFAISLTLDPANLFRYFIYHGFGIYAVTSPIVAVLNDIHSRSECNENIDSDSVKQAINNSIGDSEVLTLVRHCKDFPLDPATFALYGMIIISARPYSTVLIIVDGDTRARALELRQPFPPKIEDSFKNQKKQGQVDYVMLMRRILQLPNQEKAQPSSSLKKNEKNSSSNSSMKVLLANVMKKNTSTIKLQDEACCLIQSVHRQLVARSREQRRQLETLNMSKVALKQNAERIAEKYEDINEKYMELRQRMEVLNIRIQAPVKSVAEERFKEDIYHMKSKCDTLLKRMVQSQTILCDMKTRELTPRPQTRTVYLHEHNRKTIYSNLHYMSDNIKSTRDRITTLMRILNFINIGNNH